MARRYRPRDRRVVAPIVAGALMAGSIALFELQELPSWLGWCPPWMAAVLAAALGVCVLPVERWTARRNADADQQRQVLNQLRGFIGRGGGLLRMDDPRTLARLLGVHPSIDAPPSCVPVVRDPWWRRLSGRRATDTSGGLHPDLPLFVERDKAPDIRSWMREAGEKGGFLILVGNPCVGKTRLLYETARQELPDFVVLIPGPGGGGLVNSIAAPDLKLPKLIVWLDELQSFLPGGLPTDGSVNIDDDALQRLLPPASPSVVIVGTIWPDHLATLRAHNQRSPDDPGQTLPRYPDAVRILDRRDRLIRLDTFSDTERARAKKLAARDPRLATALADPDYGVTQFLAGAKELDARYDGATDDERAVFHAAIDARRVGIQAPLTDHLLCAAARGYSDVVHPDDTDFVKAIKALAANSRSHDRATAPLIPVPSSDKRTTIGYRPADYLLHQHSAKRRTEPIPGHTWGAFDEHTHDHADLARLADHAWNRLLYEQAIPVYQRLIAAGDETTARRLAELMVERDRLGILCAQVEAGDWIAARRLADLLLGRGNTTEAIAVLRSPARAGDWIAICHLADLLVRQERIDEAIQWLRPLVEAGNLAATLRLAVLGRTDEPSAAASHQNRHGAISELESHMYPSRDLDAMLARRNQADNDMRTVKHRPVYPPPHLGDDLSERELRELAEAGDDDAAWNLADLLIDQDRVDEAISVLRALSDAGYEDAAGQFIRLLGEQGRMGEVLQALPRLATAGYQLVTQLLVGLLVGDDRVDELRELAEAGDGYAAWNLADLLLEQGRDDEAIQVLQTQAKARDPYAARQLVYLLASHNRVDELRELAEDGDGHAAWNLADLLLEQGRDDEAIQVLQAQVIAGNGHAARQLVYLLASHNRVDKLRELGEDGNEDAARLHADLVARQGGIDGLRAEVRAGTPGAAERWITMLAEQGQVEMAERIRRFGLIPTGDIAESR